MYGVDSKDSVPADFPKKNSGLAPEGLSILAGTGAGHRPLWCPTMALKIKIPGGSGGMPPDASFPVPTRSLGQMRKLLRGPGQATYDFDGVRPGLLVVKKGWPAGQTRKNGYGGSSAQKERDFTEKEIECAATSFFPRRKKKAKTPPGVTRTPLMKIVRPLWDSTMAVTGPRTR